MNRKDVYPLCEQLLANVKKDDTVQIKKDV